MQLDAILERLEGVRPRGQGRWAATCPAHADKSPSLSVKEGERGLLLRCFAGCELPAICDALNIELRDLFFDAAIDPRAREDRALRRLERERQREAEGRRIDRLREAEYLVRSAMNIDISQWTDDQLDQSLNALAGAYELLEKEEVPCHG